MKDKGLLYGVGAYVLWGVFPIYWKLIDQVPASEILVHRILWSLVFLALLLTWRRQWSWIAPLRWERLTLVILVTAAALLAVNWFTYIWGVNSGFIVETSLGYFINPLVNVLLGVLLLHERMRTGQWIAISVAGAGVLYLTLSYGSPPWIALILAFTFGFYGLLTKKVRLGAAQSQFFEMAVLFIPALTFMVWLQVSGKAYFGQSDPLPNILLIASGIVTAVPLLLFSAAARRIPLSTLGLLQYIAPTMQFLIGVLVFGEPFTTQRLIGFSIIWIALIIYSLEGLLQRRSTSQSVPIK
jgi:chloramphenicol-sensitive protein RarD